MLNDFKNLGVFWKKDFRVFGCWLEILLTLQYKRNGRPQVGGKH